MQHHEDPAAALQALANQRAAAVAVADRLIPQTVAEIEGMAREYDHLDLTAAVGALFLRLLGGRTDLEDALAAAAALAVLRVREVPPA